MATLYTRTYTYTGKNDWVTTNRSVPWSSFSRSGDTAAIEQIVSIRYEHYHGCTSTRSFALQGQLTIGSTKITSDTVTKNVKAATLFTNTFTTLPTAAQFNSITSVETLLSGSSTTTNSPPLTWNASEKFKMKVIVEYYDVPPWVYHPQIEKFSIERCTSSGVLSDSGTYGLITLKLNLASSSYASLSDLNLYYQSSAGATTYSIKSLKGYINSAYSSEITINTYSLNLPAMGDEYDWNFRLTFDCIDEVATAIAVLPNSFVSLHISPNGDVSVGDLSQNTTANPRFESHLPSYFEAGIEKIASSIYQPTLKTGYSTPGEYGGTLTFRRIGNLAIVSGSVRKEANATQVVCVLPDGFTPSSDYYAMAPCTGAYVARVAIYSKTHANAPGQMGIEYVCTFGSSSASTAAMSWIDLSMFYWID